MMFMPEDGYVKNEKVDCRSNPIRVIFPNSQNHLI
jgi:hypothetical protein